MLRSYLEVALRQMRGHRAYYAANLIGLLIGIASALAILLFVWQELSYDRYHVNAARIYRVATAVTLSGERSRVATSPAPMGPYLRREVSGVAEATRIWHDLRGALVERNTDRFYESGVYWADESLFRIFSHRLLRGDPQTLLAQPNTVVITESMARKYFGDSDPVGQKIRVFGRVECRVTGVIADVPRHSHFTFDFMASMSSLPLDRSTAWLSFQLYTYVLLAEHADPAAVEAQLAPLIERNVGAVARTMGIGVQPFLQPLTDLHLYSGLQGELPGVPGGNVVYVYVFSALALLVLVMASANYVNLATGLAVHRWKEIGVRKVAGAHRSHVAAQFLVEAVTLTAFATLGAAILVWSAAPLLRWMGVTLTLGELGLPRLLVGLVTTALIVGVVSGLYPALCLSRPPAARVLQGRSIASLSQATVRKGLVVVQCAIAAFLVMSAGVITAQLRFMQTKDVGFDPDRVIIVAVDDRSLDRRHQILIDALERDPNIERVAGANNFPGGLVNLLAYAPEGTPPSESLSIHTLDVDYGFIEVMGMRIVEGRSFSRDHPGDDKQFVVNETAVRSFGWTNPIGKRITRMDRERSQGQVIGVLKDFNFFALTQPVTPIVMQFYPVYWNLAVKARAGHVAGAVEAVKRVVAQFSTSDAIPNYWFLDEHVARLHREESRLARMAGVFALLAVLIAVIGILSIVSLSARQRAREIGVRKILGASRGSVAGLLVKEMLVLAIAGVVIAWPLAWLATARWLQQFPERIAEPHWLFGGAAVALLAIACATAGVRAMAAAMAPPAGALRYE